MLKPVLLSAAFAAAFSVTAYAQQTPIEDVAPAANIDHVFTEAPNDHVIGADAAVQTMIVYASVTCGHCGTWFSDEWPAVKAQLVENGTMRFILRELPTAPAVLSMTGFVMAECAADDKYYDVIEYQMENQKQIFEMARAGKGQEAYAKVGAIAGLNDDAAIEACLSDQSNLDHVQRSTDRANAAGVKGVPAFYINGAAYDGAQDAQSLIKLITDMDKRGVTELPETLPKPKKTDHSGHNH